MNNIDKAQELIPQKNTWFFIKITAVILKKLCVQATITKPLQKWNG